MLFIRYFLFLSLFISQSALSGTLLVLGDSLSAGYGIQPSQGWVALLKKRLKQEYPDIRVINASISGETTDGGVSRLPELIEEHRPDWILIELGANDGLRGTPIPLIEENLSGLISMTQDSGAKPLLIGMRLPPNYGPRYTEQFFTMFSTLSEQREITLVPFLLEGVALDPTLMQSDGLHPNEKAQPILLETVWVGLSTLLED
jgi:acyl-CoA thioesterase-1